MALKLLTDGTFRPKKEKNPKTYTRKSKHKKIDYRKGDDDKLG